MLGKVGRRSSNTAEAIRQVRWEKHFGERRTADPIPPQRTTAGVRLQAQHGPVLSVACARTKLVYSSSRVAFCLYLQRLPAMLAVDGIRLVPVQAAFRTLVLDLGRLEYRARKLDEQRHAHDHDEDGQ